MTTCRFACPVCGQPLAQEKREFACAHNHHFDSAKEGYINLLLANEKATPDPGDSLEMVEARAQFLEKGFYAALADTISDMCLQQMTEKNGTLADIGCGQGYYTQNVFRKLSENGMVPSVIGIDISKNAIRYAARHEQNIQYAVASIKKLPLLDESVDVILNIFAPRNFAEFSRILTNRGRLIIVSPGPNHLNGLKSHLLLSENEHAEPMFELNTSLTNINQIRIADTITLTSSDDILHLCMMTPFWWKVSHEGRENVQHLSTVTISLDFIVTVFEKN